VTRGSAFYFGKGVAVNRMEKYDTQQNIALFLNLLEEQPEGAYRERLKGLLLQEEDRFGKIAERLGIAETVLETCSVRIRDQRVRINGMDGNHPRLAMANFLLANMLDIHSVVKSHRDYLQNTLDGD
jgi:hypothetical protein